MTSRDHTLHIEWSSRNWGALVSLGFGVVALPLGGSLVFWNDQLVVRAFGLFFAAVGAQGCYLAVRHTFWPCTNFVHADAREVRWGDSDGYARKVDLERVRRIEIFVDAYDSEWADFELDDGEHIRASLRRTDLLQLLEFFPQVFAGEIVRH